MQGLLQVLPTHYSALESIGIGNNDMLHTVYAPQALCQQMHTNTNNCEWQDEYKGEPGTVIAADFYHANTLLPLSDAEIIAKVKQNLGTCEPAFQAAQVLLLMHTSAGHLLCAEM